MDITYVFAGLGVAFLLLIAYWPISDHFHEKKQKKEAAARSAAHRKTFKRRVFPAIEAAPLPACRNDTSAPLQLPMDQPLLSYTDALTTCEVILDGESFIGPFDSDYRNGPGITYRNLAELEGLAKKYGHQEWLIRFIEPLQSFVYQRHGPGQWNLVKVGTGMF